MGPACSAALHLHTIFPPFKTYKRDESVNSISQRRTPGSQTSELQLGNFFLKNKTLTLKDLSGSSPFVNALFKTIFFLQLIQHSSLNDNDESMMTIVTFCSVMLSCHSLKWVPNIWELRQVESSSNYLWKYDL